MTCRMGDLRNKEVINLQNGARIGYVCDIELDARSGSLLAIVIYGRLRLLGLLGRQPDLVIPWGDVSLIGDETVLVSLQSRPRPERAGALQTLLEKIGF